MPKASPGAKTSCARSGINFRAEEVSPLSDSPREPKLDHLFRYSGRCLFDVRARAPDGVQRLPRSGQPATTGGTSQDSVCSTTGWNGGGPAKPRSVAAAAEP